MLDALVITVKDRESRVSSIQKQLEPFSIKCHLLEAVDARKSSVFDSLKPMVPKHVLFQMGKQRKLHREINTQGAIGCFASHKKAWELIAKQGRPCLILEDDFSLSPVCDVDEMRSCLKDIYELLARNVFDCVQIARDHILRVLKDFPDTVVRLITPAEGAYSYMLSPRGAAKLLEEFVAFECHVDHYMGNVAYATVESDEPFKLGAIMCPFYRQDDLPTTLHTEQSDTIVMTVRDYESMYPSYYRNPYRYNRKTKSLDGLVSLVKSSAVEPKTRSEETAKADEPTPVDRIEPSEPDTTERGQTIDRQPVDHQPVDDQGQTIDQESVDHNLRDSILSQYVPVESHAAIRRAYWFNSTVFIVVSLSIMMLAIIVLIVLLVLAQRKHE